MPANDLYLQVREKEGRLYPDEIVARLPEVPKDHPLRREWQARRASLDRLTGYVAGLSRACRILELGCGNGWLSGHLSALKGTQVLGLDRHSPELTQAARLFNSGNLAFLAADIFEPPFQDAAFDLIVIASAIQYFDDLPALVRHLLDLLRLRGELHILDSPLYEENDLQAARERTQAYYAELGFPEMATRYFHHTHAELRPFAPRWHYRPETVAARFSRSLGKIDSPFPWISIARQ
jgi:SAM-dependent methyltransferase